MIKDMAELVGSILLAKLMISGFAFLVLVTAIGIATVEFDTFNDILRKIAMS